MYSCRVDTALLLAVLASLGAFGCSPETSQLLVVIDTNLATDVEPPVEGDAVLRSVHVEVCDESCEGTASPRTERSWAVTRGAEPARVGLPFSFGVAPFEDDATRRVEIRVEARRRVEEGGGEAPLFEVRRRLMFQAGRTVEVPIFLSAACLGVSCPDGYTCNAVGECEPEDVTPIDDAGVVNDAGATDAGPGVDGGCEVSPPAESLPLMEVDQAASLGTSATTSSSVTALADGPDGSLFVAVRDGAALSVRRLGSDASEAWSREIATSGPGLWFGQVTDLAAHDGSVYAVGTIGETWSIGSLTADAPEPSLGFSDSRRHGVVVFALNALDGSPRWAHVLKWKGVTEVSSGLVVDGGGVVVASYAIGGTVETLELDGETSTAPIRGAAAARASVFRFSHDGALRSVLGVTDEAPANSLAIAAAGGGDLLLALATERTRAIGIDPTLPQGSLLVARLAPDDTPIWARSLSCATSSRSFRSVEVDVAGQRAWLAFSSDTGSTCGPMRVERAGSSTSFTQSITGDGFLASLALVACSGDPVPDSVWSAEPDNSPFLAVGSVAADARGLVITGVVGSGGADFGGGVIAGLDTGDGTDGFLVGIEPTGEHVFSNLFGGQTDGLGPDDAVDAVVLRASRLYAGGGFTGSTQVDGVSVPAGPVLLAYTRP